jgi:hypothetical protein
MKKHYPITSRILSAIALVSFLCTQAAPSYAIRSQAAGENEIAGSIAAALGEGAINRSDAEGAGATGVLRSKYQARLESYTRRDMPRAQGLDEAGWFKQVIISNSGPDKNGNPYSFEETLNQWELKIVYYPTSMCKCSFGDSIRWGFNYCHTKSNIRIELGQDDVVSLGLLSETEVEGFQREYKEAVAHSNDQWEYLRDYLAGIEEHIETLLTQENLTEEDRVRLNAFWEIARVNNYYNLIDVFAQEVEYGGQFIPLAYDDLRRYAMVLGELADSGIIVLDRHKFLPTELQRLRTQIARAVQLAQKGDFSLWDNIAAKYSLLLENLSSPLKYLQ